MSSENEEPEMSSENAPPGVSSKDEQPKMSLMSSEELRAHGNQLKTQFHTTGDDRHLNSAIDGENFDYSTREIHP